MFGNNICNEKPIILCLFWASSMLVLFVSVIAVFTIYLHFFFKYVDYFNGSKYSWNNRITCKLLSLRLIYIINKPNWLRHKKSLKHVQFMCAYKNSMSCQNTVGYNMLHLFFFLSFPLQFLYRIQTRFKYRSILNIDI